MDQPGNASNTLTVVVTFTGPLDFFLVSTLQGERGVTTPTPRLGPVSVEFSYGQGSSQGDMRSLPDRVSVRF